MIVKTLSQERNVDADTGCRYRYIYSESERFTIHNHEFYEIFITINKQITHMVNGQNQILPVGSLVFIRPNDVHTYVYETGKNYNFVNLAFDIDTMESILRYIDDCFDTRPLLEQPLPPVVILPPAEKKNILLRLNELNEQNGQDRKKFKLSVRLFLLDLFAKYFAELSLPANEEMPFWLEALCEQMHKQKNFTAGIGRMEQLSGKSREHIARCIKKHKGVTSTEFVNELRLNFVANMLINSNTPILDLCFESGFTSVGWFYTLFKEKYGLSPFQFRESTKRPL